METITIPSPSAFLRKSPVNDSRSRPDPPPTKNAHRRPLASSGQTPITAGVQNGGITKPKQSKSRNGCITCKGKRLKCDESKPTCEQCRKRNVQCGGYCKAFKWRSFEEANFTGKSGPRPKKGNYSKTQWSKHFTDLTLLGLFSVSSAATFSSQEPICSSPVAFKSFERFVLGTHPDARSRL
jgi:Fungal Zn(2)-Cys(6) binuclear cluster domain